MTSRSLSTAFLTLLTMLTTAVLALALGTPAQAHSELISASPEDGAELDAPPTEIVLEFNEDITSVGTEVVVTDGEGTPITEGEVVVDGPTVTQAIGTGAAGEHTVTWRAVSEDGHPISGEYTFAVAEPATTEPATTGETSEATTTADPTTEPTVTSAEAEESDTSDSGFPWIPVVAVVVAAGVIVLLLRRNRAR